jgi:uncharacterized protein YicC (UPF0701 family)
MGREINTMGSQSTNAKLVVQMKDELENQGQV